MNLLEACHVLLDLWDACGDCRDADELMDFVTNNFDVADTARAVIEQEESREQHLRQWRQE